jgi:hypothetical protein
MYKDVAKNIDFFKIEYPNTIVPTPISQDYENGFIDRYFITQKVNDKNGHVFEIDSDEYFHLEIENPYWKVEKIKWRISGPIDAVYYNEVVITDDMGVISSNSVIYFNNF